MPASRRARATTLMPRSWPSRPILARTRRRGGLLVIIQFPLVQASAPELLPEPASEVSQDAHVVDRVNLLEELGRAGKRKVIERWRPLAPVVGPIGLEPTDLQDCSVAAPDLRDAQGAVNTYPIQNAATHFNLDCQVGRRV